MFQSPFPSKTLELSGSNGAFIEEETKTGIHTCYASVSIWKRSWNLLYSNCSCSWKGLNLGSKEQQFWGISLSSGLILLLFRSQFGSHLKSCYCTSLYLFKQTISAGWLCVKGVLYSVGWPSFFHLPFYFIFPISSYWLSFQWENFIAIV